MDSKLKGLFGGGDDTDNSAAAASGSAASSPLAGLFGGGGNSDAAKSAAHDFINRVQQGQPHEGFSHEEAVSHLAQAAPHVSQEEMHAAARTAVARLPQDQRAAFGQMLQQRMSGQAANVNAPADAATGNVDSVAGMLSQVLGGGALGGMLGGGGQGGSGGLGGMLSGMLGGSQGSSSQGGSGDSQGGGDVLGGIFKSNVGKAVLGGLAAAVVSEVISKHK